MCRIVINPQQLADTASVLVDAAGEYQAIGASVAGCDCGCMPADVAAVVDSVTASVRSGLQSIGSELAAQAAALGRRSAVDQDGATTGGSSAVDGGSFDMSIFGSPSSAEVTGGGFSLDGDAQSMTISGGGFDMSTFGGASAYTVIGGNEPDAFNLNTQPQYTLVGGGDFQLSGSDQASSVSVDVGGSGALDILRDPYYVEGIGRIPEWGYGEPIVIGAGGYGNAAGDLGTTLRTIQLWGNVNINTGPSLFSNPRAWNAFGSPYR